ncbi:MAG: VCBS repeat-containing protein [Pontiellaceae bacterium]|nr:VCBS repeat-containing protein [Pontiellaceae bacterium]
MKKTNRAPRCLFPKIKPIHCTAALLMTAGLSIAAEDAAQQRTIGFQPLEIHTFKPGASRLTVEDLNQDGLDDVIFANNNLSRLEILIRKPNLENLGDLPALEKCFDDRGIIVDQGIGDLHVEDLNNDGRKDLVTFGGSLGLQIRYQQADGSFAEPEELFMKDLSEISAIRFKDVNADERKDLVICRRNKAEIYWNTENAPFQKKKTLNFSGSNCISTEVADVNDDGIQDLIFFFSSATSPVTIRFGQGHEEFGVEQPIQLPSSQFRILLGKDSDDPKLGMVLQSRLAFRTYRFEEKDRPALMETQETSPLRIGFEGTGGQDEPAWLVGDFNGDKFSDLLVAAPQLSRIHLYAGVENGLNPQPTPIDSLSQIERMSKLSNGDVLVISTKEKIVAVHTAGSLDQFPKVLKTPGEVLAGCGIESGKACWLVCKDEDGELQLARFKDVQGEPEMIDLDLRNEPTDILAFSLPNDTTGILLFIPYETPKMYIHREDGLEELGAESFRAIAQQLNRENFHLEKPGRGEFMTVTQGAVARRFEWKEDHYEVIRQFNPENPQGELIAACAYSLYDGSAGTMFFDRSSSDLVYFSDEENDWGKIHISDADQTVFNLVQLQNGHHDIILLIGQNGVDEVVGNGKRLEAVMAAEYTSPAEEPMLVYARDIKLGESLQPMVALVDTANRSIEIIKEQDGKLVKELGFEVFLITDFSDTSSSRGVEPHDLESGDLNGDGIGDLIALCQDKLLIYLGE